MTETSKSLAKLMKSENDTFRVLVVKEVNEDNTVDLIYGNQVLGNISSMESYTPRVAGDVVIVVLTTFGWFVLGKTGAELSVPVPPPAPASSSGVVSTWVGWQKAMANMANETVRWFAFGDSITEGTGNFTQYEETWLYKGAGLIRDAFPDIPSNSKDSIGYRPGRVTRGGPQFLEQPWEVSGSFAHSATFGLRPDETLQLTGSGSRCYTTVNASSMDVWYAIGTGTSAAFVYVDGNYVGSIGGQGSTTYWARRAHFDFGSSGNHYIEIRKGGGGDFYMEGTTFYNDNENAGIVTFNGARHGYTSGQWVDRINRPGVTYWDDAVAAVDPHLVMITLGANDYNGGLGWDNFISNMAKLTYAIRNACTVWPTIVLAVPYRVAHPNTPSWPHYEYGLSALANQLGCAYFDFGAGMPPVDSPEGQASGLYYDQDHPTSKGTDKMSELIAGYLLANAVAPT